MALSRSTIITRKLNKQTIALILVKCLLYQSSQYSLMSVVTITIEHVFIVWFCGGKERLVRAEEATKETEVRRNGEQGHVYHLCSTTFRPSSFPHSICRTVMLYYRCIRIEFKYSFDGRTLSRIALS